MSMVSIILPVYNAENTLPRCLSSIQCQTFTDFEVLMVNDGSKDNSQQICQDFCEKDSRFILINQENSGPSKARNIAIDRASSKYLAFVDSDDYIDPNSIEVFYTAAEECNADLSICSHIKESADNGTKPVTSKLPSGVYTGADCRRIAIQSIDIWKSQVPPYSWIRFVKRECLENPKIRFNHEIHRSEDYLLWTRVFFNIKTLCVLADHYPYHYVENSSSLTHTYISNYWSTSKILYNELYNTLPTENEIQQNIDLMLIQRSFIALNISAKAPSKEQFIKDFNDIIHDKLLQQIVRKTPIKLFKKHHRKFYVFLKFRMYVFLRMIYTKKYHAFVKNPGLLMYR